MPVTSDCDADIMQNCMRDQGRSFSIGQVKTCLVDLGVPSDPSIVLAAEVSRSLAVCLRSVCLLRGRIAVGPGLLAMCGLVQQCCKPIRFYLQRSRFNGRCGCTLA